MINLNIVGSIVLNEDAYWVINNKQITLCIENGINRSEFSYSTVNKLACKVAKSSTGKKAVKRLQGYINKLHEACPYAERD